MTDLKKSKLRYIPTSLSKKLQCTEINHPGNHFRSPAVASLLLASPADSWRSWREEGLEEHLRDVRGGGDEVTRGGVKGDETGIREGSGPPFTVSTERE